MWETEIAHDGLNKHRVIRGRDRRVVEEKARIQRAAWHEQWERKLDRLEREEARREAFEQKEENERLARERTDAALEVIEEIRRTLEHTLSIDDTIRWDELRHEGRFAEPEPTVLPEPDPEDPRFRVRIGLLERLLPGRRQRRQDEARELLDEAVCEYDSSVGDHQAWQRRKGAFLDEQHCHNRALDEQEALYEAGDPGAVEEYCDLVLSRSEYPDSFPQEFDVEYLAETKRLIIEYQLPNLDAMPRTREVRYVKSRNEFDEKELTDRQIRELYDGLCYQICLRTIHEVLEADCIDAISSVAFNGWVEFVSPETGNETRSCILSIHVTKEQFSGINLAAVEPKACFRALKGVGSAQLHKMAAVPPVVTISRDDRRFVDSQEVIEALDEGVNLASIHWEEFEHLVRELFAQEFSADGSEVRVTQSSRDGGVDAIAFDPDPIRGGKIVIQAKRYTNVVGVSAVRDLYGTLMSEGATKGILVTTSNFGSDAYEFVKGKPITLLDGGNLLHLMEKHGHRARIDLREAKARQRTEAAA